MKQNPLFFFSRLSLIISLKNAVILNNLTKTRTFEVSISFTLPSVEILNYSKSVIRPASAG